MSHAKPLLLAALLLILAGPASAAEPSTKDELAAANALLDTGKYEPARKAFEEILARAPEDPDANYSLGLFLCDDGEWEKALRLEGKALASDPNNARYQYGWASANGAAALKAGVFSRLGYAKKCLAAYQRAVELEPRNLRYRSALLNYYQQAPGFAGGDRAKAFEQAAAIKNLDAGRGRQAFVQLYLSEKKPDLAFLQYDEALRQTPEDYLTLHSFGRLTLITGQRLDEGLAAFRRLLELTPPEGKGLPSQANVHWHLGKVWEKKKQPDKAREAYVAALEKDPAFQPATEALAKLAARKS